MDLLLLIVVACAVVWTTWFALRGSLLAGCMILIGIAACFGYQFWHSEGSLPSTIDRTMLVLLVAIYGIQRWMGGTDPKPLGRADWVLFAFLAVLSFSTFTHDWSFENSMPIARLVIYWIMPAVLYWIARQSNLNRRNVLGMFAGLAVLELYLIFTGLAEASGQWWAVFPQYIALPKHQFFGRVRGPFLNPPAMGIYLTAGAAAALMFWPQLKRWRQLLLLGFVGLAFVAMFGTLTRSVWMGAALGATIFLGLALPRQWRRVLITLGVTVLMVLVLTKWDSLLNLKRDENLDAAAAADSAELRPLLANVAWNMFLDRPLLGFGFGQYDRERMPYLADRTSELPLDKTEPYVQHNAFLALLTDTGALGMGLFALFLVLVVRDAWSLWANAAAPLWVRQCGLLLLVTLGMYLPNSMFHDTNIIDGVNLLLFLLAGVVSGLTAVSKRSVAGTQPFPVSLAEPIPVAQMPRLARS